MSGYIGTTPVPQATQHREAFTANANQTTFATAGYTVGYIDVWVNGVKLAAADVTVTNGSDIVLASAAAANDIVEYLAFVPFEATNQTFTGATVVNSLNLNGDGATVTGIKDEDNMASNDANKLATQQSIKAYVDTTVGATNEVVEDTTPQLGGDLASNGNDILMADNDKVIVGTGSDLQLYHSGTYNRSYIQATGTNHDLTISADEIALTNSAISETFATFVADGAVTLYYDNAAKLATTSAGVSVTGTVTSGELLSTVGLQVAGHPVVGYASFDSGYATRLGSTGSSTLNATQIYAGGVAQATFKGGNVGIGETDMTTYASKLYIKGSATNLRHIIHNTLSSGLRWELNSASSGSFYIGNPSVNALTITSAGAATFAGTVTTATQVKVSGSNASTVAFSVGDTGTGWYNAGSNAIALSSNGIPSIHVTSGGNVGIGTASPDARLDIEHPSLGQAANLGETRSKSGFILNSDTGYGSNGLTMGECAGTAGSYFISVTNSGGSASYPLNLQPYGGNVGIGTTTPSARLDVVSNDNVWVGEFTQSNTSNGDGVLVQVGSTAAADYALSVRSNAGSTSGLAVKADGAVGIGTFTPDYTLSVKGPTGDGALITEVYGSRQNGGLYTVNFLCGSDEDRVGLYWRNAGVVNTRMWCDDTMDIRIHSGAPSSDTDGTVVGTQTFSGTHIYKTDATDLVVGQAVRLVGRKLVKTTSANDKLCVGIYSGQSGKVVDSFGQACNETDGYGHAVIALGDTRMKQSGTTTTGVLVDGSVSAGDLLCTSSTAGKLTAQADDIIRSYTVGKAIEDGDASAPVYAYIYCG